MNRNKLTICVHTYDITINVNHSITIFVKKKTLLCCSLSFSSKSKKSKNSIFWTKYRAKIDAKCFAVHTLEIEILQTTAGTHTVPNESYHF